MTIITRFAPSPSGRLHLGHALSAIIAHDLARQGGGHFLLRIDDIDAARSREDYAVAALDDLLWLGLEWDGEPIYQSSRLDAYDDALKRLNAMGLLYPCFCTRADIAVSLSAPHGDFGPLYPGTCRELGEAECIARADQPHCWRLDMAKAIARAGPLEWREGGAAVIAATPELAGDAILARKDAPASYHLASTVDDAAMEITDVVRGRDLFASTHVHRLLQALLDLPTPHYHHHVLIAGPDGKRLAKRDGATELAAVREAGMDGPSLADDLRVGRLPSGYSLREGA